MKDKVILITGASRGIGREIAKIMALDGYKVIANYLNSEQKAIELKKELESLGANIEIFRADVSKREEVKKMVDFVIETYGKMDVLINNAGVDQIKLFTDITDEDWDFILKNNLYSAFCVTQEVVKHMISKKEGKIINISSIYGVCGGSCEVHYAVSKAGMIGLTKSLAKELALSNISINAIAPGAIKTDMDANLSQSDWEEVKKEIPLGKIGKPADVAKCVKWMVEDEYMTGQVVEINGGWNM